MAIELVTFSVYKLFIPLLASILPTTSPIHRRVEKVYPFPTWGNYLNPLTPHPSISPTIWLSPDSHLYHPPSYTSTNFMYPHHDVTLWHIVGGVYPHHDVTLWCLVGGVYPHHDITLWHLVGGVYPHHDFTLWCLVGRVHPHHDVTLWHIVGGVYPHHDVTLWHLVGGVYPHHDVTLWCLVGGVYPHHDVTLWCLVGGVYPHHDVTLWCLVGRVYPHHDVTLWYHYSCQHCKCWFESCEHWKQCLKIHHERFLMRQTLPKPLVKAVQYDVICFTSTT